MRKFGLIGYPLGHSFSKKYFTKKFENEGLADCEFELYPISSIDQFPALLKGNPNLEGVAVTIPYKEQVIPYLNELDPACRKIGAVNSIHVKNGKLIGFNTDYLGFKESLQTWLPEKKIKALILGTGGASKAVAQAFVDLEIPFISVSRKKSPDKITYEDLAKSPEIFETHHLVINCTPLGTFPKVDGMPEIPIDKISAEHMVFDLVYNPPETSLMKAFLKAGGSAKNGLEMLEMQAEASWSIWNS